MDKRLILASAFCASALMAHPASAQSPWESGTYKSYDQNSSSSPDTSGLQGYSLSPSPQPAAPAAAQPTKPTGVQSSVSSATVPATPQAGNAQSAAFQKAIAAAMDGMFIAVAQRSGQSLLDASQAAQKKASSQATQTLAGQIVAFYKPVQSDLASIAKRNHIAANAMVATMSGPGDDKQTQANSTDFDKQYFRTAGTELSQLVSAFKRESGTGQNAALKDFAAKHLADLEQTQQAVKQARMAMIRSALQQKSGSSTNQTPSFTAPAH